MMTAFRKILDKMYFFDLRQLMEKTFRNTLHSLNETSTRTKSEPHLSADHIHSPYVRTSWVCLIFPKHASPLRTTDTTRLKQTLARLNTSQIDKSVGSNSDFRHRPPSTPTHSFPYISWQQQMMLLVLCLS